MARSDFAKAVMISFGVCLAVAACDDTEPVEPGPSGGTAGVAGTPSTAGSAGAGGKGNAGSGGSGGSSAGGGGTGGSATTGGSMPSGGSSGNTSNAGESAGGVGGEGGGGGGSPDEGGAGGVGEGGASAGGAGGDGGDGGDSEGGAGGEGGSPNLCDVAQYGTPTPTRVEAEADGDDLVLTMRLQDGIPRDEIEVELFDGNGTFASGIKPGTYEITGFDLDLKYCNLCVRLFDQVNEFGGHRGWYMATGGTLTLTSVEGQLTGSLTNLTFQHTYQDNGGHSVPWGDGCTTKVDKLDFDAEIE